MSSLPILYEGFVALVSPSLASSTTPPEATCFICGHEYGKAGAGLSTKRDFFNELPYNACTTYVQNIVDPVSTPCGHTFCKFCICTWLLTHKMPNCPICRKCIKIPTYRVVTDKVPIDVAVDAFSIALRVSTPVARDIHTIFRLSTRDLMTTEETIPLFWHAPALITDLPKLMVTIARRFHYQSTTNTAPPDLTCYKLHSPCQPSAETKRNGMYNLEFYARGDAPISKHPDAQKMYTVLVEHIEKVAAWLGDAPLRPVDWRTQGRLLFTVIWGEMRDADGGVGEVRWWAYVWYVCKTLVVWQAYCERMNKLTAMRAA